MAAAVRPASRCCHRSIHPPAILLIRNCIRADYHSLQHHHPVILKGTIRSMAVVVSRISARRTASPTARTRMAASARRCHRLTISPSRGMVRNMNLINPFRRGTFHYICKRKLYVQKKISTSGKQFLNNFHLLSSANRGLFESKMRVYELTNRYGKDDIISMKSVF